MKKNLSICTLIFCLLCLVNPMQAQTSKTTIQSIKLNKQSVELTIVSTKAFYVGGNIYALFIGKESFTLSNQEKRDGKGYLTFFIPIEKFNLLKNGSPVYLFFGDLDVENINDVNIQSYVKEHPETSWTLGFLRKKMLKK